MDQPVKTTLPRDLIAHLEAQTGARLTNIRPRGGGGASRKGAAVTLSDAGGAARDAYLSWDTRIADPRRHACFTRERAILAALSGPLAGAGLRAPALLGDDPAHLALLTALVDGADRYDHPQDDETAGRDFIAQLAILHKIDPASTALEGFGNPHLPVSQRIRETITALRAENLATAPDAILLLALSWLEQHIPPDSGPATIVHGDAGPGNFLHRHGKVTALLDWELCHYGDPAEDLAQICVRSLFQPFMPPPAFLAAYTAAGGASIDTARLRFHRLYFQAGFSVSGHAALHAENAPVPAAIGTTLLFYTAHMRVMVQSLAALTGTALLAVTLPDTGPGPRDRTYAQALDDLRDIIAPRAADQESAARAKALARLVKFWRARDRFGAACDAAEIAETASALGRATPTVPAARAALAQAVETNRIDFATALRLCHARVTRETFLMRDAMGRFADTDFQPLTSTGVEFDPLKTPGALSRRTIP